MTVPSADRRPASLSVRPAGLGDAAAVARLLGKLAEQAHADHPITATRVTTYLRHCGSHPDMYVNCVAEAVGGRAASGTGARKWAGPVESADMGAPGGPAVVGFLSAVFYETPFHDKGTCLINELIVDADSRGSGVGRSLVETAKAEAKRRGMDEIEVGTEKTNLAAQRFYKRLGFDEEFVLLGQDFHRE